MPIRFPVLLICLFALSSNAYALREEFEQWLPKGFVSRSTNKMTPELMPKEVAAKVDELNAYNKKIEALDYSRFQLDQAMQDDYISQAERDRASKNYDKTVREMEKIKAEKVKIFGPDADEVAAGLVKRARKLGDAWSDMAKKTIQANALSKPTPPKSAAFIKAEAEVNEWTAKLLQARKLGTGLGRAKLGKLGKAAVIAVPAATAAAVMGSGGEAEAGEIKASDLPEQHDSNGQRQDVDIGELDAQ